MIDSRIRCGIAGEFDEDLTSAIGFLGSAYYSMAPIPAVRQKRSNELFTSCQAISRPGTSASDEGMLMVIMLLLSIADSTIRA
jgi:hypothetical protein